MSTKEGEPYGCSSNGPIATAANLRNGAATAAPDASSPLNTPQWIAPIRRAPEARWRLLCFPHAGGSGGLFQTWLWRLPPVIELWSANMPGRGVRFGERPLASLEPVADAIAVAVVCEPGAPFAFFGFSMGALIAFEVVRRIQAAGARTPVHLFAAACRGPSLPSRNPNLHDLPTAQMIKKLRELGGTPDAVLSEEALLQQTLPVIRADLELIETYKYAPGPPLDCPITVMGGEDDPMVSPAELQGWVHESMRACRLKLFPGQHFFVSGREAAVMHTIVDALYTA